MRYSIAAAGLALTFLSLCQNFCVQADQQFEAPSTETIQTDEKNNEGYFGDDDDDDEKVDEYLPAPAHNRAEFQNIPDQNIVDDQRSEESPDLTEGSNTPAIPEAMHPTVDSDTAVPEPEIIRDDPSVESEYSNEHDIEPELRNEEPKSRAFDEPPTEDSVVSDDADIPATTNVESEVPLSKKEEREELHMSEVEVEVDEDSVKSDDANEASSRSKVEEAEAPSTVDEGPPDEHVNEDTIPSENKQTEEPRDQEPQLRNEEPDDDPSYLDLDDVDSADSLPEERSTPPEDKLLPSVDAHAAEHSGSVEDAEEVRYSAENLNDRIEEESTPEETVNLVDADGEEPSQPHEGSSADSSDQDDESDIKVDNLNSNETEESMQKETSESAALDEGKPSQPISGSPPDQDKESDDEPDDMISEEDDGGLRKASAEKATADAGKPSEPKSGSLASFFNKVSAESDKASGTMTKSTKMNSAGAGTGTGASKKDDILEGEAPVPYCGVWGVFRWERPAHADLSVLFLLFQDYFMSDSEVTGKRGGNMMDITDMASIMTDEIIRQGQQKLEQTLATPDISGIADAAKPKSVNHEFVEGLDDIDKLFEGVDPPDELDVGAAGSSMQEVLMGQGTRILLKRISIGAQMVKKTTISLKNKAVERFQNKDFKVNLPEKEEALRVAKEASKQAAQWVWTSSQQVFQTVQAILDDMFEGEDLDDLEFDVPRPPVGAQKAGTTTEQDEEMEQFLRQWRGSENK